MRTVVAICLIALIATSFASKSKSKTSNKAFSKDLESALSLKQGLKMLVELAQDDETREVRRVLEGVRDEVAGMLQDAEDRYASEESDYENVRDQYLSQLSQIQTDLENTQVALEYANEQIDSLTETIAESQEAIADADAQQAAEEARRVAYHQAFRERYDQLSTASDAVEDALKWIIQIDNEDLEASFLQVNNKKIYKNAKKINHIIKKLELTHMNTYVDTFLEVASEGINRDLVDKLTVLLVDLGNQIDDAMDDAVAKDNADDAYSRAVLGNLQSTIDVENSAIADNTDLLNQILANAEFLEENEDTLGGYLESTAANFEAFQETWEEKADNYDHLIARLKQDIVALDAADNFLDS